MKKIPSWLKYGIGFVIIYAVLFVPTAIFGGGVSFPGAYLFSFITNTDLSCYVWLTDEASTNCFANKFNMRGDGVFILLINLTIYFGLGAIIGSQQKPQQIS